MAELFLIRKGGYYYRPNARGYTASVHEAGRFPKEEAFAHMDACAPGEIVIFPAPTISVSIAVEDDIRVTAEKIVLEHVASGSLNMDNLAGAIAGALEEERAKASAPAPEKPRRARPMTKLTEAVFSMQCSFIAKNAAAWAGDILTLPEHYNREADPKTVGRFTDEMRERLDRLDQWAGRTPAPQPRVAVQEGNGHE